MPCVANNGGLRGAVDYEIKHGESEIYLDYIKDELENPLYCDGKNRVK